MVSSMAPDAMNAAPTPSHGDVPLPAENEQTAAGEPVEYEALSQPQASSVMPPTYGSAGIPNPTLDASTVTSTSSPPTMTTALVSSLSPAQTLAAPTIAPPICLRGTSTAMATPGEAALEKKSLTLLELPTDILRLIVKEITHTNDLTSLALVHSTLYHQAIPQIYSRFDIVWPDPSAPPPEGKNVDALTYGLSTLCLGSAFARTAHRRSNNLRRRGQNSTTAHRNRTVADAACTSSEHTRFGSPNYAQFTRKFSLGNGPPEWFADYMINKEAGKMLGTLVALSVAKMQNLENFVWDMPTGVMSDVFMALAALPDFDPVHKECKLDRLWIRWHNNSRTTQARSPPGSPSSSPEPLPAPPQLFVPQGSNLTPVGIMLPAYGGHPRPRPAIAYASSHVEYPTFSVVPPLRSLTVLDIDEVAYLDELAVLIERSYGRLNELRIGIASHAVSKDFVQTWDGSELQQVDLEASWPGESIIGDRRLGGVLGTLVGRIYDIRKKSTTSKTLPNTESATAIPASTGIQAANNTSNSSADADDSEMTPGGSTSAQNLFVASPQLPNTATAGRTGTANTESATNGSLGMAGSESQDKVEDGYESTMQLDRKLKLTTLELERVPLSMQVLVRAIDWTSVTALTILSCPQDHSLWRQLRKNFRPTPAASQGYGISPVPARLASGVNSAPPTLDYYLALKKIHTDRVCKTLLSFISDTLAPNSLEVLILQNRPYTDMSRVVSIQDIFKSAVKPHSASLTKLLINGYLWPQTEILESAQRMRRIWTLPATLVKYVTSGRMASLRELAFSLHYRDWHTFLQRLPGLPQLRSLHILNIADHVVENLSMYDLAMQITDVVTLRPETPLCFVAICDKCYEIVESRGSDTTGDEADEPGESGSVHGANNVSIDGGSDSSSSAASDDEDEDANEDNDSDGDIDVGVGGGNAGANGMQVMLSAEHDSDADVSDSSESDQDSQLLEGDGPRPMRLRMREIFFYDEKVAIFKARHGRL
ncbi:hypothetical protein SEPCBS57363_004410 [Sporothrix epigloea]|uniref:F-box domain-containing protein n=1 Tax=Sporothrix epigloea TaxID=1892477 RepID=A0ABP0DVL9_9PEZI